MGKSPPSKATKAKPPTSSSSSSSSDGSDSDSEPETVSKANTKSKSKAAAISNKKSSPQKSKSGENFAENFAMIVPQRGAARKAAQLIATAETPSNKKVQQQLPVPAKSSKSDKKSSKEKVAIEKEEIKSDK